MRRFSQFKIMHVHAKSVMMMCPWGCW